MSAPDNEPDQRDSTEDPAHEPPTTSDVTKDDQLPQVIQQVDKGKLQQFVTQIKSAEQQVGAHIIAALEHDDTVAVLTTVVAAPTGQLIVSVGIDPELMQEVQKALTAAEESRIEEVPCVGFHCYVKPKNGRGEPGGNEQSPE